MPSELYQRIRAARHFAGLSQATVAKALGVTRPNVALLESIKPENRIFPSAATIQTIARLTGISAAWLMDDSREVNEVWGMTPATGQSPIVGTTPPNAGTPPTAPGLAASLHAVESLLAHGDTASALAILRLIIQTT